MRTSRERVPRDLARAERSEKSVYCSCAQHRPRAVVHLAACDTQAGDMEVQYSLDGNHYTMLRIAHVSRVKSLQVGVMCASPEGGGFSVTFESLRVR